jgi:hypothetical protein
MAPGRSARRVARTVLAEERPGPEDTARQGSAPSPQSRAKARARAPEKWPEQAEKGPTMAAAQQQVAALKLPALMAEARSLAP